jgi:hypothetical protein
VVVLPAVPVLPAPPAPPFPPSGPLRSPMSTSLLPPQADMIAQTIPTVAQEIQ